ncbi:MAG: hypothetical protein L3J42_00985 [Hydrogenimonas sp.]|nr:hypothetical protein [Hydrogenimonas sp.]
MGGELTTKRLLKAWWAMQWRAVLATFIGAFVLIALFSFFAALFGVKKEFIMLAGNLIYTFVAIFASIYFFGFALKKDYGSFRFAVVEGKPEVDRCEESWESSPNIKSSAPHSETNTKESV